MEIIFFGETISMLNILSGLLYTPLVYDYVRRNKMGTYGAGATLVTKIAGHHHPERGRSLRVGVRRVVPTSGGRDDTPRVA